MNKHSFMFLYTKPLINAFIFVLIFCSIIVFIIFDEKEKAKSAQIELAQTENTTIPAVINDTNIAKNIEEINQTTNIEAPIMQEENPKIETQVLVETPKEVLPKDENLIQYKININLNIREKPSKNADIVGSVRPNSIVTQLERRGNWIRIDKGWVFRGENTELVE